MYAASAPRRAGLQVVSSAQSNRAPPPRAPIRTSAPSAASRSATRRPLVPVPPLTRVVGIVLRGVCVGDMAASQPAIRETIHGQYTPDRCPSVYDRRVDALASLLDGPRGRGAFLLRTCMEPPLSVRFAEGAPLGLIALLHGAASLIAGDGATVHLAPGDVAVMKGADPVTFAEDRKSVV